MHKLHFLQMHDSVQLFPKLHSNSCDYPYKFQAMIFHVIYGLAIAIMTIATEVCRLVEGQQFELITTLIHNRVSRLLRSIVLWSIMFA